MNLSLQIPFDPVACPRPRVTRYGVYYPPKYTQFKKDIVQWLSINCKTIFEKSIPLHIDFKFIHKRQKKHTVKKYGAGRIWKTTRPDLDNYVKAINDGLQSGGVIADDSQIISMTATKQFGKPNEPSSIIVDIQHI